VTSQPLLMSAPMVPGTIAGIKTQTRRTRGLDAINEDPGQWIAADPPTDRDPLWMLRGRGHTHGTATCGPATLLKCPYRLGHAWIRETHMIESNRGIDCAQHYPPPFCDGRPIHRVTESEDPNQGPYWEQCHYAATDPKPELCDDDGALMGWRPSIHMPRWASRISIDISSIRLERLHDISEADAIAEGIEPLNGNGPNRWTVTVDNVGLSAPTAKEVYRALRSWRHGYDGPLAWDANPWVWALTFRRCEDPEGL
jgi:hypothetical protein